MWKRIFLPILINVVIILPIVFLFVSYAKEESDKTFSFRDTDTIQEWVKRTNFAIEVGTDIKPKYFLETIQPVWKSEDEDLVFFNQSRISEREARPMYNVGFGLRKASSENYFFGINAFYDYQDLHRHSRGGAGLEAFTYEGLEARVNTYLRISKKYRVNENASNEYYEEVANGLDYECGNVPTAQTQDFSATPITVTNGVADRKVRVSFDVSAAVQLLGGELWPAAPTVTQTIQ